MILVLLQNGWARTADGAARMEADRKLWVWALSNSRSGRRLAVLFGDEHWCANGESGIWWDNTTPRFAYGSSGGIMPSDPNHVRRVIAKVKPSKIVACGAQAESVALDLWTGPLLCVPHPAHRLLTDDLYMVAKTMLADDDRVCLRQERGKIKIVKLAKPGKELFAR